MSLFERIKSGAYDAVLSEVYPERPVDVARERIAAAAKRFAELFGSDDDAVVLSAPGRTELGGNHTDHNHGRVLAGSVSLDMTAVAKRTKDNVVRILSEGFPMFCVPLDVLSPVESEANTSQALVRGVAADMARRGYSTGGFDAYVTSEVLKGSGLSSSAAFEVLMCTVFDHLYNKGEMKPVEAAIISRYAENAFFMKPCGLMDQMACATGGFVAIDFKDTENPVTEAICFDLKKHRHTLCIVDTRGDHGDLTASYAAIPGEMKAVARLFGKEVLREVEKGEIIKNAALIRKELGDRAFLRAVHFADEDERAQMEAQALREGDFEGLLALINKSGDSSYMYLQNVCVPEEPTRQEICVAIYLSKSLLNGKGAVRVHGGGFAGTIQAIVPDELVDEYKTVMEGVFGDGSCHLLDIRAKGAMRII